MSATRPGFCECLTPAECCAHGEPYCRLATDPLPVPASDEVEHHALIERIKQYTEAGT